MATTKHSMKATKVNPFGSFDVNVVQKIGSVEVTNDPTSDSAFLAAMRLIDKYGAEDSEFHFTYPGEDWETIITISHRPLNPSKFLADTNNEDMEV